MRFATLALAALVAFTVPGRAASLDAEGSDVLGKRLPDWGALRFVDAPVHRKPSDYKGKVVLIRF